MFDTRRRRLAWLFVLVLLMELALLCCAYNHTSLHLCCGHRACALCARMRSTLLRELILPACILSLLALGVIRAAHRAALSRAPQTSLFNLGVRLND